MTFRRFEEIDAWKQARELCNFIRKITSRDDFSKDWALKNQIRSSSGSVMDCIAEGHGRSQNNEFRYMLAVAKGSCEETRSQCYRASDSGYISEIELAQLVEMTNRISASLFVLIKHINNLDLKGVRTIRGESPTTLLRETESWVFPSEPPMHS